MTRPASNPPDDGICFKADDRRRRPLGLGRAATAPRPATPTPDHCGDGGSCFSLTSGSSSFSACLGLCSGPGTGQGSCRTGYVCDSYVIADGGTSPDGICWPDCHNPGRSCGAGGTCSDAGYCE